MKRQCLVEGCTKEIHGLDLCGTHYRRFKTWGTINGSQRVIDRASLREGAFSNPCDSITAYFAGVIYGDGSINSKESMLTLCNNDADMVYGLQEFLNIKNRVHKYGRITILSVCNKKIVSDLRLFGVVPRKSYESSFLVPEMVNFYSFLRGLYDSDGWCSQTCREVSFIGTAPFCEWLQKSLIGRGIKCANYKSRSINVEMRRVNLGSVQAEELAKVMLVSVVPTFNVRKTGRLMKMLSLTESGRLWIEKSWSVYANTEPIWVETQQVQRLLEEDTSFLITSSSAHQPALVG